MKYYCRSIREDGFGECVVPEDERPINWNPGVKNAEHIMAVIEWNDHLSSLPVAALVKEGKIGWLGEVEERYEIMWTPQSYEWKPATKEHYDLCSNLANRRIILVPKEDLLASVPNDSIPVASHSSGFGNSDEQKYVLVDGNGKTMVEGVDYFINKPGTTISCEKMIEENKGNWWDGEIFNGMTPREIVEQNFSGLRDAIGDKDLSEWYLDLIEHALGEYATSKIKGLEEGVVEYSRRAIQAEKKAIMLEANNEKLIQRIYRYEKIIEALDD